MLETAASPNNSGLHGILAPWHLHRKNKTCFDLHLPIHGLARVSGHPRALGWMDDAWHGMARNDMAWHCMARNGMAWHAHHPWGEGGSLPAAPLREPGGPVGGHGGGICVSNRNTYFLQSVVPLAPLAFSDGSNTWGERRSSPTWSHTAQSSMRVL